MQAWGGPWTGAIGRDWMVPDLFCDMARALERACFDYILIEDSSYVGESFGGSTKVYLKHGIAVPRQDPAINATLMAAATTRIGVMPTFATFTHPPYLLARMIASLDRVSSGRIGWNMVTGSSDVAARNDGLDRLPEHDLRYDMAGRKPLRETLLSYRDSSGSIGLVGTPDAVSGQMAETMEEVAGDDFLISMGDVSRRTIAEVADGLVPARQRSGLARRAYGHAQFRENLLEF